MLATPIALATLEQICLGVGLCAGTGILLPSEVRHVVQAKPGEERILLAIDGNQRHLTQTRFSQVMGRLWSDLPSSHKFVLQKRLLNPRAMRDYTRDTWPMPVKDFLTLEQDAHGGLIAFFTRQGIRLHRETVGVHNLSAHYYFIPAPEETTSYTVEATTHVLTRSALKNLIFDVLLALQRITTTQALFALNAFVSGFRLNVGELSLLTGGEYLATDEEASLAEYQRRLERELRREAIRPLRDWPSGPLVDPRASFADIWDEVATEWPEARILTELGGGALHSQHAPAGYGLVPHFTPPLVLERGQAQPGQSDLMRYQTELRDLALGDKLAQVAQADSDELRAWCYDPHPAVIQTVIANSRTGIEHALLIAQHHHNAVGLQALTTKYHYSDAVVRVLLQNPTTSEVQIRRWLQPMPLLKLFHLLSGSNLSSHARNVMSQVFRDKFKSESPESKAQLIMNSGGRCLDRLGRVRLDPSTVTALKQYQSFSPFLIQKLKKHPGVTEDLVRHMTQRRSQT